MLRQPPVGITRRAAEPVEGQVEAGANPLLDLVLLVAVFSRRLSRLDGGEFGRRAVLVRGADEEYFVPRRPAVTRINIRREHRAREVAQMLDAVDVRQGRRDKDS